MILKGCFQALADKIVEDKKALAIIYQDRPQDQIEMRVAIGCLSKEWFKSIWEADGRVFYLPTERQNKGIEKLNRQSFPR